MELLMEKFFSIEDGYQIVMLFLQAFWFKFLKQKMIAANLIYEDFGIKTEIAPTAEQQSKNTLHDRNWYFFAIVCDGTSSDYFEKVIEDRLHIPPIKQSGIQVTEELLFQLMIGFCEFVNERFAATMKDSLKFAIDWLENMRKHPEEHRVEWKLWNDVVIDVREHGARSMGFF
jgi:hypothetical protein